MSRIAHWSSIALAASVALAIPATAHAQFGGLKKKLKEKIAGNAQPASASPASPGDADAKARQDAWQHPIAITSPTLDGFMKAIKAEQAERAGFAASSANSPVARWNSYQSAKAKCAADQAAADSAQMRLHAKMDAEAAAGHVAAIQPIADSMQALNAIEMKRAQQCSALSKPVFTSVDFEAIHAEEDREEAAGAAAGGFTSVVYSRLKERVIAYTLMPRSFKPSGYSAEELQVIDARRAELKKLLGTEYNQSGQRIPLGI